MFLLDRCSLYCNRWKIAFPRVTWPDRYRELFVKPKDFLKNLRMYNSAFLMVFCKLDPRANNHGIPTLLSLESFPITMP